jgi:hypothetical protein
MSRLPGGFNDLKSALPLNPLDFIILGEIDSVNGTAKSSTTYNTPSGGTWSAATASLNGIASAMAINLSVYPWQEIIARSMNMQTKMTDTSSSIPIPLRNILFLYSNSPGKIEWKNAIQINFGADSYDLVELSIIENAAGQGDIHSKVPVIDFGTGPFTGVKTTYLTFDSYTGPLNLGLRLERTSHTHSSLLELRCYLMNFGNKQQKYLV